MEPDRTTSKYTPFSTCDGIKAFYDKHNVPCIGSTTLFSGRDYSWYVPAKEGSFLVTCVTNPATLGYGNLRIQSREASRGYLYANFSGTPTVDPKTAKVVLEGRFFGRHEVTLPVPKDK